MIDLHSHVLPAIDDGVTSLEQAVEVLGQMQADGVTLVAATPHVHERWPTRPEAMEAALASVRAAVAAAGLSIDVRGGGEIAHDQLALLPVAARERFGLAGNPRLLLLEFPLWGWPLGFARDCARLGREGVVVLVAHPERSADVQEDPSRVREVVEAGAYVQLTAASVDGRLGKRPAACSAELLRLGLAHVIASDAHAPSTRSAGLSAAAEAAGGGALGRWLTLDVPLALVEGRPVPPRPLAGSGGGERSWRRR